MAPELTPWEAEQRILEHNRRRERNGIARYVDPVKTRWDLDPDAPAPALINPEHPNADRAGPSVDRRAARFRDGRPPPPPPPPPITDADIAQVALRLGYDPLDPHILQKLEYAVSEGIIPGVEEAARALKVARTTEREQRAASLVPQDLLDRTIIRSPRPSDLPPPLRYTQPPPAQPAQPAQGRVRPPTLTSTLAPAPPPVLPPPVPPVLIPLPDPDPDIVVVPESDPPPPPRPPEDPVLTRAPQAPQAPARPDQPLTTSQKRRLRRKRHRGPPAPASNGVSEPPELPPPPAPIHPPVRPTCQARVNVHFPDATQPENPYILQVTCPLAPWPHPGQPHHATLPPSTLPEAPLGTEAYLVWWDPPDTMDPRR